MLKDWKKIEHTKLYGEDFIVYQPKHKVFVRIFDEPKEGQEVREIRISKPYNYWQVRFAVKFGRDSIRKFKTKAQALRYAKNYMRRN